MYNNVRVELLGSWKLVTVLGARGGCFSCENENLYVTACGKIGASYWKANFVNLGFQEFEY